MGEAPRFPMRRAHPLDPPPELRRLQDEHPITRVTLPDGSQPWLVTRYDDVREVLGDPRYSASVRRPGYPRLTVVMSESTGSADTFITMDPPEHGYYRRMFTAAFSPRHLEALRDDVQALTDRLLDALEEHGPPADLVEGLTLALPSSVICHVLGVPYDDHDFFQSRSRVMVRADASAEEAMAAGDDLRAYLSSLLERKERDLGDDLLSRLLEQQVASGALARRELTDLAMLLLIAGHETTANSIALGAACLMLNPDQAAQLRSDASLMPGAVEEILRFNTIQHLGRHRVATDTMELCGQTIRPGDGIIATTNAANRDPRAFPDPDVFDIHRDAEAHLGFGFGLHQCLGQHLARLELGIALGALLRRFPALRLAVPLDEVPFKHDVIAYGVHELPVTW